MVVDLRVDDVMARKVFTIEPERSVKHAAKMMSLCGISSLVVLSKGEVVGILTERDLVARVMAKGLDPSKAFVGDVMSRPVIVIGPSTPLETAIQVMLARRIKKLPVTSSAANSLMGILSLTDVARLHPVIYANMKELEKSGNFSVKEGVDFYIC